MTYVELANLMVLFVGQVLTLLTLRRALALQRVLQMVQQQMTQSQGQMIIAWQRPESSTEPEVDLVPELAQTSLIGFPVPVSRQEAR